MTDVPDNKNVTTGSIVASVPITSTNESKDHNALVDKYLPASTVIRMHRFIICAVLILYACALGYGIYSQSVWLIGSLCAAVIIPAMRKIINRYL